MRDPQLLYNQICHQLEEKLSRAFYSCLLFLLVLTHTLHPDFIQINLKYLSDTSLQNWPTKQRSTEKKSEAVF